MSRAYALTYRGSHAAPSNIIPPRSHLYNGIVTTPAQLVLRLWLGAALAIAAGLHAGHALSQELIATLSAYLPIKAAGIFVPGMFDPGLAICAAVLLMLGLATRFSLIMLMAVLLAKQMSDPALTEDWYWLGSFEEIRREYHQ